MHSAHQDTSYGVVAFHANMEFFQGLVPLLPHLCPLSVPQGGGGVYGYIRKALEKGYLEHPGSACCTDNMFEIFGRHQKHLAKNSPVSRPKTGPF